MSRKDWSPRGTEDLNVTPTPTRHGYDVWWDMIAAIHENLGYDKFTEWFSQSLKPWSVRLGVIKAIAENDRNSEYFLGLEHIIRTHKFESGQTVTAEIVSDTITSMVSAE